MNKSISYVIDQIRSSKTREKDEGLQCLEILIQDFSSTEAKTYSSNNIVELSNESDKQYFSLFSALIELIINEFRGSRQTPTRRLVKATNALYASVDNFSVKIKEDTARFLLTNLVELIVETFKEHDFNTEGFSMVVKSLLAICKKPHHLRHLRAIQINAKTISLAEFIQTILLTIRSFASITGNGTGTTSADSSQSQYATSDWPISTGILSMLCECLHLLYKETVQLELSAVEYIWETVNLYFKSIDEVLEAHLHIVRLSTDIIRTNLLENTQLCHKVAIRIHSIFEFCWQKKSSALHLALLCLLKVSIPILKAVLDYGYLFGSASDLPSLPTNLIEKNSVDRSQIKENLRDIYVLLLKSYVDMHPKNRLSLEDIDFFPQACNASSIDISFDSDLSTSMGFHWVFKDPSKFECWFLLACLNKLGLICNPIIIQRTWKSAPSSFDESNNDFDVPRAKRLISTLTSSNESYICYLTQSLRRNIHDNSKSLVYIQLICFYFRFCKEEKSDGTSSMTFILDQLAGLIKGGNDELSSWAILCIGTVVNLSQTENMIAVQMRNIIDSTWGIAFKRLQARGSEDVICYYFVTIWRKEMEGGEVWTTQVSNKLQPTLDSIVTSADVNGPQTLSIASFEFWKLLYNKVQITGSKNNSLLLEEKIFGWLQKRWNLNNSPVSTNDKYYIFDEIRSGLPSFLVWMCGYDLAELQLLNSQQGILSGNLNNISKCELNVFCNLRDSVNYLYRTKKLSSNPTFKNLSQTKNSKCFGLVSPAIIESIITLINNNIVFMAETTANSDGNISAPQMSLFVHSLAISLIVLIVLSERSIFHEKSNQCEFSRNLPAVVNASVSLIDQLKVYLTKKGRLLNDSYLYQIAFYTKIMRDVRPLSQTEPLGIFNSWVSFTQLFSDQTTGLINLRLMSTTDVPQSFFPEDRYIDFENFDNISTIDSSNLFLLSCISRKPSFGSSHWAEDLTLYLKTLNPGLLMKEKYIWLDIFSRNILQGGSYSPLSRNSVDPVVLKEIGDLMVYVGTEILRSYIWEYTDLVFRFVSDLVIFFSSSELVTYDEESTLGLTLGSFYGWILNIAVDSRTSLFSRIYCLCAIKEVNILVENKRYFQLLVNVLDDLLDGSSNLVLYSSRGLICEVGIKHESFASFFNDDFFLFLDQISSNTPERRAFNQATKLTLSYALNSHFQESLLNLLLNTRDLEIQCYVTQCIDLLDEILPCDKRRLLLENSFVDAYSNWASLDYSYSTFPAVIFGFSDIKEFLYHYLPDIVSLDIVIKGPQKGMQTVAEVSILLGVSSDYVLLQSLAKVIAYSIGKCDNSSFSLKTLLEFLSKDLKLLKGSSITNLLKSSAYDIYREVLLLSTIRSDDDYHDIQETNAIFQGISQNFDSGDYTSISSTFSISVSLIPSILAELEAFSGLTNIRSAGNFCVTVRSVLSRTEGSLFEKDKVIYLQKFKLVLLLHSDIALAGYPYELVLHSILPFLFEPICSEVAKDIFSFLVTRGKTYLSLKENTKFLAESSFLVLESYLKSYTGRLSNGLEADSPFHESLLTLHNIFALINSKAVKFISFGLSYILCLPDRRFEIDNFYSLRDFWQSYSMLYHNSIKLVYYKILLLGLETDQASFDWSAINCMDPVFINIIAEILKTPDIKFNLEFIRWASKLLVNYYASGKSMLVTPCENRTLADKLSSMNLRPLEERPVVGILYLLKYKIKSSSLREMMCADNIIGEFYDFMVRHNKVLLKVSQRIMAHDSLHEFMVHRGPIEAGFSYRKPVRILEIIKSDTEIDITKIGVWLARTCEALCLEIEAYYSYFSIGHLLNGLAESTLSDIFNLVILQYMIVVRNFDIEDKLTPYLNSLLLHTKNKKIKRAIIQGYLFCRNFGQIPSGLVLSAPDIKLQTLSNECQKLGMLQEALFFYELGQANSPVSHKPGSLSEIYEALSYCDPDLIYGIPVQPSLENMINNLTRDGDYFKAFQYKAAEYDCTISLGKPSGLLSDTISNSLSINGMEGISSSIGDYNSSINSYGNSWRLDKWDLPEPNLPKTADQLIYKIFKQIDANTVNFVDIKNMVFSNFGNTNNGSRAQVSEKLQETMKFLMIIGEVEEIHGLTKNEDVLTIDKIQKERLDNIQNNETFQNMNMILNVRKTAWNTLIRRNFELSSVTPEYVLALTRSIENLSSVSRNSNNLQYSRKAIMELKMLSDRHKQFNFVQEIFIFETACLLYEDNQTKSAIQMLRGLTDELYLKNEDDLCYVSLPLALGLLGKWNSEGRYENVATVLENNFNLAMRSFKGINENQNLSKVLYLFGEFCDKQLQDPSYQEKLDRTTKFWDTKRKEIVDLEASLSVVGEDEKLEIIKKLKITKLLCESDEREIWKLKDKIQYYLERAVSYYLRCINDCDEYDHTVSRVCSIWLGNCGCKSVNEKILKGCSQVVISKLVLWVNQISSRILDEVNLFQKTLRQVIIRMSILHSYHCLYQLIAMYNSKMIENGTGACKDAFANSRSQAARKILENIKSDGGLVNLENIMEFVNQIISLTSISAEKGLRRISFDRIKDRRGRNWWTKELLQLKIPPPTMHIKVRKDHDYSLVPYITAVDRNITLASGLSRPKILTFICSNGKEYKMLAKGKDDARQDAVMEQVFEYVDAFFKRNSETRKRDLSIRTYKIVPLAPLSGVIEFVNNSFALNEYLIPSHERYFPSDIKMMDARKLIADSQKGSTKDRIAVFKQVTANIHPVLKYFFFESFSSAEEWLTKRTSYTRSTAAISMLGYILGIGDRHCGNIMLDRNTGEVIHIDFGISFEDGKRLPVPELVPFRLTRDIVDGMGVNGVEGTFRRCCIFTLDLLRFEMSNIKTILDVLRHDPLYSWTMKSTTRKKVQEATSDNFEYPEHSSDGSDAHRALSTIYEKLSISLKAEVVVNQQIQEALDVGNLAVIYCGWSAFF